MRFGSVFTGFGGFDLGLTRAGLECVWQCEINDYANRVLERHWPGLLRWRDARNLLPAGIVTPDLIVGGDPCQENSKGARDNIPAGTSPAVHFLRIVAELRPRRVLRENPYPSRAVAPWPWQRFRSGLESLGYAVLPFRLRSCCVGSDHQRDRVFLLGELADTGGERSQGIDRGGMPAGTARGSSSRGMWRTRTDVLPAPRICRGTDGIAHRMERLVGLGNAVDVASGEWIGRRLMEACDANL